MNYYSQEELNKLFGRDPRVPDETQAVTTKGSTNQYYSPGQLDQLFGGGAQPQGQVPPRMTQISQEQEKEGLLNRIGGFLKFWDKEEPRKETVVNLEDYKHGEMQADSRMSFWKEVKNASGRAVFNTLADVHGIRSLTAAVFGKDAGVVMEHHNNALTLREKAAGFERTVEMASNIRGVSDATRWALSTGIEMVPIITAIMTGGAVGGKMTSSSPLVTKAFAKITSSPQAAAKWSTLSGTYMGTFSVGYGAYASSIFETGIEYGADIDRAKKAALIYGIGASAISVVFPTIVSAQMQGAFGRSWFQSKANFALKSMLIGLGGEGLAEGVAEWFTIKGEEFAVPGLEIPYEQKKDRIIEAMAGGALMGVMFGASTVLGKQRTITEQAIDKQVELHLRSVEDVMKVRRSPIIEQSLIEMYEAAPNLTDAQKEFLSYLKRLQRKPVDKAVLETYQETDAQMVDVWKMDDGKAQERIAELADKSNRTFKEEMEFGLLIYNKPKLSSDYIKTFSQEMISPTVDGMEQKILRENKPGMPVEVQTIKEEYGEIGVKALEGLKEKGFIEMSETGEQFATDLSKAGYTKDSKHIDVIDEVFQGDRKLFIPELIRTDAKKLLGDDVYHRVFTDNVKAESLQDFADSIGFSDIAVIEELGTRSVGDFKSVGFPLKGTPFNVKKYKKIEDVKRETGYMGSTVEVKTHKQVIRESAPYILTLDKHNIDWNKLTPDQKESVKRWDNIREKTIKGREEVIKFFKENEEARKMGLGAEATKQPLVSISRLGKAHIDLMSVKKRAEELTSYVDEDGFTRTRATERIKLEKELLKESVEEVRVAQSEFYNSLNPKHKIGDTVDYQPVRSPEEIKTFGEKKYPIEKIKITGAEFNLQKSASTMLETGFPASFSFSNLVGENIETGESRRIYGNSLIDGEYLKNTIRIKPEEVLKEFISQGATTPEQISTSPELKLPDTDLPPNLLLDETIKKDKDTVPPEFDAPLKSPKEINNSGRSFETLLNIKVDAVEAQRVLLDIATNVLGLKSAFVKAYHKLQSLGGGGEVGGYFFPKKGKEHIVGVDMWNLATYAHEVGHLFDLSLYKTTEEYHANESQLKSRFQTEPLETLMRNAEKIKVNVQEILEHPDMKFKLELTKVRDYVRNWEGKVMRDTRSEHAELFASWFVLYVHEYNTAKMLSPNFTAGMELAHLDTLNLIREKYQFPVDATAIATDVPQKSIKNAIGSWLNLQLKAIDISKTEEVRELKEQRSFWRRAENRAIEWVRPPYWYSLTNEQFRDVYKAFTENAVYAVEGTFQEILEDANFLQLTKESSSFQDLIMGTFYKGSIRGRYYTEEQLKRNFSFTDREVRAYMGMKKALDKATELQIETRKYEMGYYEMDMEARQEMDKKLREEVVAREGYFPFTRSGKWIVYGDIIDPSTQQKEIAYNRFEFKRQPFLSTEPVSNANQFAHDLKSRGYTNISIRKVGDLNIQDIQNIQKYGKVKWWELLRLIEALQIDKESPEIKKLLAELQEQQNKKYKGRRTQRKDTPGLEYNWREGQAAFIELINDTTRLWGKTKAKYETRKILANMDASKHPETVRRTDAWLRNIFDNTDSHSFIMARKVIYGWFLSYKFSYLMQNMCQPIMTTMAEIGNYAGPVDTIKIWKNGYYSAMMWAAHRAKEGSVDTLAENVPESKRVQEELKYKLLDRGVNEKHIAGQFSNKMLQNKNDYGNTLDSVIGLFSIMSETANRTHAMAVGYDIAVNYQKLTDEQAIFDFMKQFSHNTQFPYGNYNVPFILNDTRRVKGLLKTLIVFKSFSLNYLNFFWYRVMKGTPTARFYGVSNLIALAGVRGLPLFMLINLMSRYILREDEDILTKIRSAVGADDSALYDYIMGGVFAWGNMSTSNLLGVGDVISPSYDPMGQVFGAGYSMIANANWGMELYARGDTRGAIERWSPIMMRNILVAQRWSREGIDFKRGIHYHPTKWEVTMKMLSFTPYTVAEQYEIRNIENRFRDRYSRIRHRYINAVRSGKSTEKILKDADKHNLNVDDALYVWFTFAKHDIGREAYDKIYNSVTVSNENIDRWHKEALSQ